MKRKMIFKLLLFFIGYIVLEILFLAGVALVLGFLGLPLEQSLGLTSILILVTRIFIIGTYLYLFKKYIDKLGLGKRLQNTSLRSFIEWLAGLSLGMIFLVVIIYLRYVVGLVEKFNFTNWSAQIESIVVLFIGIAISVLVEELVFRGTIFITLRKIKYSFLASSIITSLLFSLFHLRDGTGVLDLVFYFFFSILLCSMVERRKNIWTVFGFHLGWNYIAVGGSLFNIQYFKEPLQLLWAKMISILVILSIIVIYKTLWKSSVKHKGGEEYWIWELSKK